MTLNRPHQFCQKKTLKRPYWFRQKITWNRPHQFHQKITPNRPYRFRQKITQNRPYRFRKKMILWTMRTSIWITWQTCSQISPSSRRTFAPEILPQPKVTRPQKSKTGVIRSLRKSEMFPKSSKKQMRKNTRWFVRGPRNYSNYARWLPKAWINSQKKKLPPKLSSKQSRNQSHHSRYSSWAD